MRVTLAPDSSSRWSPQWRGSPMSVGTRSLEDPELLEHDLNGAVRPLEAGRRRGETLPKFNLLEASIGTAPSSPGAWARQRRLQNL
jgi:hypothetical protein